MRIRTIKPEFWTDSLMVSLEPMGRLVFLSLFNLADDHGCFTSDLEEIAMLVFPREDPQTVADWIDFFAASERLELLSDEKGRSFYRLVNWEKHQKVDKPSRSKFLANPRETYRKRAIPNQTRRDVALKYGCEPGKSKDVNCFYCGASGQIHWHMLYNKNRPSAWVTFGNLELEHLESEFHEGVSTAHNMVLACRNCNRSKATKPWHEHLHSLNSREASRGFPVGKDQGSGIRDQGSKAGESRPSTNRSHEGFEDFWQAYPKKVGKSEAQKSWDKIKPNLQTVLNALSWQKNQPNWMKDGGQYIPNPSTYLNQGRYNDEQPDIAAAKKREEEEKIRKMQNSL